MLVLSLSLAVSVQVEDSRSHGRWMVRCWSCVHLASAPLRWLPLVTWSPLPVLPPAWPRPDVTTTISPSFSTATESQLCSERLQAGKCCVVTLQLLHSQPPPPPLTLALILLMSLSNIYKELELNSEDFYIIFDINNVHLLYFLFSLIYCFYFLNHLTRQFLK